MSILLIDVGNTRVKWARFDNGRLGSQQAQAHAMWRESDFSKHLFTSARGIERVIVVSVAGSRVKRILTDTSRQRCNVTPEFFKSQRRVAGITTKYEEPWRLGADRLVAVIGAHHLVPKRVVCVVDIGTAMTIDLVDARGMHRGGVVIPGPELMVASLLQDTSGIHQRTAGLAGGGGRTLFARNTRAAVEQGARHAIAAAIDRAIDDVYRRVGAKPRLILTGGAVQEVRRLIRTPHRLVPDLVLRGLAVAYHLTIKPAKGGS